MKKNFFRNLIARRDLAASAFKRCVGDEKSRTVIGAELAAWSDVVDFARFMKCDRGASHEFLRSHIRERMQNKGYARVAKDYKCSALTISRDDDVVQAYLDTFVKALRLVA